MRCAMQQMSATEIQIIAKCGQHVKKLHLCNMSPHASNVPSANLPLGKARPFLIGLTGGIAAGKSLVGRMFEALDIPVWNADEAAKKIYQTDEALRQVLVERWGSRIGHHDVAGNLTGIKLPALADIVFNDPAELNWLEAQVHPAVAHAFDTWASDVFRIQKCGIVAREAAILFESKSNESCDVVVTVEAPLSLRVVRAQARTPEDKPTREDILKRVERQWQRDERVALADFVIENDDMSQLLPQVLEVVNAIRASIG